MTDKKEMKEELPSVSVVVPVFNGEKNIGECIKSLLELDYPKERLKIIIVDNNSTDSTKEIIKRYSVKYLLEKRRGSYNARNTGIKKATGEIIAFTDSDCIVGKDWITNLIRGFSDEKVGGVGGRIIAFEPRTIVEQYSANHIDSLNQEMFVPEFIVTANAAYRHDLLKKVGYFEGSLSSGGDVDMGWKVNDLGYRILYEKDAGVYHKHRTTLIGLFKQFFKYGEGHVKLFKIKKQRKKINKRYLIDIYSYKLLILDIFRILWRLINVYNQKKEKRMMYISIPICHFIEVLGEKLGLIYGSIKYREIRL